MLKRRREKLAKQLKKDEILFVFAASEANYPRYFLQDNNFLYFTGLQIPNAILVIKQVKNKANSMLFIERGIPEMEVWIGKKTAKEEAKKISGIDNIHFLDELNRIISLTLSTAKKCFVNIGITSLSHPMNKQQIFIKESKERFPQIMFENINDLILPLRSVKEKWEIKQIQKAIDITGKGIEQIYKKARAGMMEFELEAILNYEITKSGIRHLGFKSIIATGKNAATLHYESNNSKIGKNDLILLDVGASCNNYSADISRTFPVSGKFTDRQKAVYEEVLKIQKAIIKMIKPGIGFQKLNKKTVELITESLKRLNLIKEDKEYKKYYMHSVGHHLGMDTHDIGKRDSVLQAGNVITLEPGIYIPEEGIGVRIEDDILVTKDGYKILSGNIPKEIEEIERG
ncbi:MAG: aminopeptidase P family protein [Armatimonadetes bacterium]|nr:aminopeptidase P family protein [Armatimonadota bacterium]